MGKGAGVDEKELALNLQGESSDPRTKAALDFAGAVIEKRGLISDADFDAIRNAGYTQREIVEIIATVIVNLFGNYFNHVAQTEIDFPFVSAQPVNA